MSACDENTRVCVCGCITHIRDKGIDGLLIQYALDEFVLNELGRLLKRVGALCACNVNAY